MALVNPGTLNALMSLEGSLANAAAFAQRNPYTTKAAGYAARKVQSAFRKSRKPRRKPTNVGFAPSTMSGAKTFTGQDSDPVLYSSRQLYQQELTAIPKATTNNDIDSRQRDKVYLSGIKTLMSISSEFDRPCHFRCAVVVNKLNKDGAVSPLDFFRGTGETRGLDFSTVLNSNDFRGRLINTDKYEVISQKSFTIATTNSGSFEPGWKSSYNICDFYTAIKRVITYDEATANSKIHLVWWCDEFNTEGGDPGIVGLRMSIRNVTFFKEPKVIY